MKTKLIMLTALSAVILLFPEVIHSQQKYSLAVYYKHLTSKNENYRRYYPLGFGSTVSRNISDKLALSAGFEYSRYHDEYINRLAPVEYISEETFTESHYSLITGMAFSFLEKKLSIRGGGDILSTIFINRGEISRYLKSTGELDTYTKSTDNVWDLGIKLKVDLQYNLTENLSILIQPGFIHYFFSDARESDFFCSSAGVVYKF